MKKMFMQIGINALWAILLFVVFNFIAVWLWGVVAVGIFALPALSFWQMFGLRILVLMIFPSYNRNSKDD